MGDPNRGRQVAIPQSSDPKNISYRFAHGNIVDPTQGRACQRLTPKGQILPWINPWCSPNSAPTPKKRSTHPLTTPLPAAQFFAAPRADRLGAFKPSPSPPASPPAPLAPGPKASAESSSKLEIASEVDLDAPNDPRPHALARAGGLWESSGLVGSNPRRIFGWKGPSE